MTVGKKNLYSVLFSTKIKRYLHTTALCYGINVNLKRQWLFLLRAFTSIEGVVATCSFFCGAGN